MQVHRTLGCGFQEVIYQRALAVELRNTDLGFARELEMPIWYGGEQIGTRRVDFLIADRILVELKAISALSPDHHAQIINYLEAYQLEVGLLINFGQRSLFFKRFVKTIHPPI